jgi:hypothetical protein
MRTILTIAFLCIGIQVFTQPVFEHTFQESAARTTLETLGEVYYSMDVVNKKCLIYDMDYNLLKSISLPTPEGYYLEDIRHLSENLFNQDGLIELVYIYSKYVPTELSYYFTFESRLINESGSVILSLPGVGFTDVIVTSGYEKKLLAYEYNYSVIPYRTITHVYGLPEGSSKTTQQVSSIQAELPYPNPAGEQIRLPVNLPGLTVPGKMVITDVEGRILRISYVEPREGYVTIPTLGLAPGSYLFHTEAGERRSEVLRFVVR